MLAKCGRRGEKWLRPKSERKSQRRSERDGAKLLKT